MTSDDLSVVPHCRSLAGGDDYESAEETMKYICLGYFDENKWEAMSESEQHAFFDECFAYDDVLRKNGHIVGGEALQKRSERGHATMEERQNVHHRWPVCRDERAIGRIRPVRSQGPKQRHRVDV